MKIRKQAIRNEEEFWGAVSKADGDGCWVWIGSRLGKNAPKYNYGMVKLNDGRHIVAHRAAWEYVYGEIPFGVKVLHTCDNPPCCRPDHLFLGTQSDNLLDADRKGRLAWLKTKAKITSEVANEVRMAWLASDKKYGRRKEIAERFGITVGITYALIRGETWKSI